MPKMSRYLFITVNRYELQRDSHKDLYRNSHSCFSGLEVFYLYAKQSLLPLLGTARLRVARVSLLSPNESPRRRELSALLINDVVRYVLLNAQAMGILARGNYLVRNSSTLRFV